jgi:hypothetical protein
VLRYQGTELRPGDIFIMRTGYVRWHSRATSEQRKACQRRGTYIGVKNDEEMKAWLWWVKRGLSKLPAWSSR